jgi:hypothetical protein
MKLITVVKSFIVLAPGPNFMKLFTAMFVIAGLESLSSTGPHPILMFVGKARSLPPERCFAL